MLHQTLMKEVIETTAEEYSTVFAINFQTLLLFFLVNNMDKPGWHPTDSPWNIGLILNC